MGCRRSFNHCVVKAIALTTHTLLRPTLLEHCSVERHLVVPALIRVLNKFGGAFSLEKSCLQRTANQLKDGAPCHGMRNDLSVLKVHASRQVELLAIYTELGDIGSPLLVWRGCSEVALQTVESVHSGQSSYISGPLLCANQRSKPHLLHQPAYAFMVNQFVH